MLDIVKMSESPLLKELEQELDWRRVEFHACRDELKKEQETHKSVQKDLEFERNSNKRLLERVMQTEAKLEHERNANRTLLRRISETQNQLRDLQPSIPSTEVAESKSE